LQELAWIVVPPTKQDHQLKNYSTKVSEKKEAGHGSCKMKNE
jgi:hypothetical protein